MEKRLERGAGILLPISSIPSPYGIGSMGAEAYEFVDQMVKAGQKYWQVLPIGPTSFGDSPYQSFSTFAGNPYFIDLDQLVEEGLLQQECVKAVDWGTIEVDIQYATIYEKRFQVLRKAFFKSKHQNMKAYWKFVESNSYWLEDYSLYMACKDYFDNREWSAWEDRIRLRTPEGMDYYRQLLSEKIEFWKFIQFKFYEQWYALKQYANDKGVSIIGDIPIYVALDSVDVWSDPKQYQLDEDLGPQFVAGCPPDAFSDYGQKWGNPLYDWDYMERDGFAWWKRRIQAAAKMYDIVRIDHFIGVVRYYAIPADGIPVDGSYHEGPGIKLTQAMNEAVKNIKIIAEDLGVVVPGVRKVLETSGYPGMKILEFAFDGNIENEYLPHNYSNNCVVYSGTHDNETLEGYFRSLPKKGYQYLQEYTNTYDEEHLTEAVIRMAYSSVADTVIIQMQDILRKDNRARMNLPSTIGTNWRWRLGKGEFTEELQQQLANWARIYARQPIKDEKREDEEIC